MKNLLFSLGVVFLSLTAYAQKKELDSYTGIYVFQRAPFNKITVSVDGEVLIADAEGVGKGEIRKGSNADEFIEPNYQALLKFVRNSSGEVVRLQVSADGVNAEGAKESSDFSVYAGEYDMKDKSAVDEVKVLFNNGQLSIDTSAGSSNLKPTSEKDVFSLEAIDGKIGFVRDSSGKVTGITIMAMGANLEGSKK